MFKAKPFILHNEQQELIDQLSDREAGQLFKAIYTYLGTGTIPLLSPNTLIVMIIIRKGIDEFLKKSNIAKYHWNWKGGISNKNHTLRSSAEYYNWRKSVFVRDNYICQICHSNTNSLNAHHIKPFADFPDLRFDIDNGTTLCKRCHLKLHRGKDD